MAAQARSMSFSGGFELCFNCEKCRNNGATNDCYLLLATAHERFPFTD